MRQVLVLLDECDLANEPNSVACSSRRAAAFILRTSRGAVPRKLLPEGVFGNADKILVGAQDGIETHAGIGGDLKDAVDAEVGQEDAVEFAGKGGGVGDGVGAVELGKKLPRVNAAVGAPTAAGFHAVPEYYGKGAV